MQKKVILRLREQAKICLSRMHTSSYATKWNASKGSGTLLAGAVPELPLPDMIADAATLLAHSMLHCEAISI